MQQSRSITANGITRPAIDHSNNCKNIDSNIFKDLQNQGTNIPGMAEGDAWADEDAGADRQGGRETEALRDVESAHSLAGERGSPQAADAGGVCGCLAMAQTGLVSALQELGPPHIRAQAA